MTLTIDPFPPVDILGLDTAYCLGDPPAMLTGTPMGGTFSGPGLVLPSTFDPAVAGVGGPHTIRYTFTDAVSGCTVTDTQNVIVSTVDTLDFTGLDSIYCVDDAAVMLTGTPTGGIFAGPGIVGGNMFDPAVAGIGGPYTISYSYTDEYGCDSTMNKTVTVFTAPILSLTGLQTDYCIDDNNDTLIARPVGGVYAGPGLTDSIFDPSVAGAGGPYEIIYTYTDPVAGCVRADTFTLTVHSKPVISFSGLDSMYCIDDAPAVLTGVPAGGTFTGTGIVAGNTFDPSDAGVGGPYTITYTFVDAFGCDTFVTQVTEVNPLPVVSFSGLDTAYCIDAMPVVLTGVPCGWSLQRYGNRCRKHLRSCSSGYRWTVRNYLLVCRSGYYLCSCRYAASACH